MTDKASCFKDGKQSTVAEGVRCGRLVGQEKHRKILILKGYNSTFVHVIWGLHSPKLEVMPPEIFQVISQPWTQILDFDALIK